MPSGKAPASVMPHSVRTIRKVPCAVSKVSVDKSILINGCRYTNPAMPRAGRHAVAPSSVGPAYPTGCIHFYLLYKFTTPRLHRETCEQKVIRRRSVRVYGESNASP